MAEPSPPTRSPQTSQYHHFIPRFLLRNFAVFKNPGKIIPKTSKKTKNRAPKPQKLMILDLKPGKFEQRDVSDTFGVLDMYRDFEESGPDQHKLEKELSVLESAAGEIMTRVIKTFEAGKKEMQLIRKDKDVLRRFLFIMMYRNSSFGKRFEKSREEYDSDDRESMLAFMDKKGFRRPRDVWFANLRAFMEVELDEDWENAIEKLSERAYPMDARWFFMHVQVFFIAFCTPKEACDEFLLTQNVYSVYEGPTSAGPWTDYHRFAPVSPKIMIVLRSLVLPCAGIEENETRKTFLEFNKLIHFKPQHSNASWLEDLPVSRARNNYSKTVNGKTEPLPTKISRDKHVFYFPFYPLDHEHVQKINMICLENAYDTLAIVYKSSENLRTALEFYLTDKTPGFKVIGSTQLEDLRRLHTIDDETELLAHIRREDKLLPYLQLLHEFARQLGSSVKLEYTGLETLLTPPMSDENRDRYKKLGESKKKKKRKENFLHI